MTISCGYWAVGLQDQHECQKVDDTPSRISAARPVSPSPEVSSEVKLEIVQLLLKEGADVHAADPEGTFEGETALHIAAKQSHRQIVELLLEAKADINAVTGKEHVDGRKTPLDYAKDPEVKLLLLQNGGKSAIDVIGNSQSTKWSSPSANSRHRLLATSPG